MPFLRLVINIAILAHVMLYFSNKDGGQAVSVYEVHKQTCSECLRVSTNVFHKSMV